MKTSTVQAFDLESSALSIDELEQFKPEFVANKTLKDPDKIAADLATKEQEWLDSCALHAHTGRILCIGITSGLASIDVIHAGTEADILTRFWHWLELNLAQSITVACFNGFGFDLPLISRRSWINDVEIPKIIKRGRFWHDDLFDPMHEWKCNNFDQRISLDNMAKAFGFGGKTGSGADFARLWIEDRNKALLYVKNDVELVRRCAERMLGIKPQLQMPNLKPIETKLVEAPKHFDVIP